jgi:hypothetical protein
MLMPAAAAAAPKESREGAAAGAVAAKMAPAVPGSDVEVLLPPGFSCSFC